MTEKLVVLAAKVDPELKRAIRAYSNRNGLKLQFTVAQAVSEYLKRKEPKGGR